MKCPGCGFEIPEGHMYCDNCGTEINFVPDFEPEVENEINATLSGMADELNKEEREKAAKIARRKALLEAVLSRWKLICGAFAALVHNRPADEEAVFIGIIPEIHRLAHTLHGFVTEIVAMAVVRVEKRLALWVGIHREQVVDILVLNGTKQEVLAFENGE